MQSLQAHDLHYTNSQGWISDYSHITVKHIHKTQGASDTHTVLHMLHTDTAGLKGLAYNSR